MPDLVGQTLQGRYRIEALAGRGGMAEVYKVWDTRRRYWVAIKVMREDLAEDIEFLRRFKQEAQALAALSHANIVRFYSFEREGRLAFIVMDYIVGTTLRGRILDAGGSPLPLNEVAPIIQQVCNALHYAHEERLIHRDVKPGNIMIQPDGRVLLSDFGIAKAADSATVTTVMPGTVPYMSPEQCRNERLDTRTDVYSLGVVVFEMLAGRRPFMGESTEARTGSTQERIRWEHIHANPPPLRRYNPTLLPEVERVVLKALAKKREKRWPSVLAFWKALASALEVDMPARPARQIVYPPFPLPPSVQESSVPNREQAARDEKLELPSARGGVSARIWGILAVIAGALLVLALILALAVERIHSIPLALRETPTDIRLSTIVSSFQSTTSLRLSTPTAHLSTDTPTPTSTPSNTSNPTVTRSLTATPSPSATMLPTVTFTPARPTATLSPTQPVPTTLPGKLLDFETMGNWRRGDQPNGTLTQSTAKAHSGTASAQLDYSFPTGGNDFVVFINEASLVGQPNAVGAWVAQTGSGSGHFLNVWIKDAGGQVWQVPLGRVSGSGWTQMVGYIATGQPWPWTHISGPDNGRVDYPVSFYALVLDDNLDTFLGSGTIYIDDISVWRTDSGLPTPVPSPTLVRPTPTSRSTPSPTSVLTEPRAVTLLAPLNGSSFKSPNITFTWTGGALQPGETFVVEIIPYEAVKEECTQDYGRAGILSSPLLTEHEWTTDISVPPQGKAKPCAGRIEWHVIVMDSAGHVSQATPRFYFTWNPLAP